MVCCAAFRRRQYQIGSDSPQDTYMSGRDDGPYSSVSPGTRRRARCCDPSSAYCCRAVLRAMMPVDAARVIRHPFDKTSTSRSPGSVWTERGPTQMSRTMTTMMTATWHATGYTVRRRYERRAATLMPRSLRKLKPTNSIRVTASSKAGLRHAHHRVYCPIGGKNYCGFALSAS